MATSTVDKATVVAVLRRIHESLQSVFDQAQDEEIRRGDLSNADHPSAYTVSLRLGIQVDELDTLIGVLEEAHNVVTAEPEEIKMMAALRSDIKNAEADVASALDEANLSERVVNCLSSARGILASTAAWIDSATNPPSEASALSGIGKQGTSDQEITGGSVFPGAGG